MYEDVGYILIYYLYTDEYESFLRLDGPGEYRCSMHTYAAVRQFGFEGLVEALKSVIDLASEVYLFQIIDIALEGWHILKCDDKYTSHLEGTIMGVFREDSDLFKTDWFMDYFNPYVGSDQGLRKFLAQTMERAYSRKLLELRSRGEVERDVIEEPPCEKHLAKRRRRE